MKQGYCPWPRRTVEGHSKDPAYGCWENMIQRCTNPNATKYENYGGRGISVHPSFISFRSFIEHIGPRPSDKHSINRIDNSGNYEPGNVEWATYTEQASNTRCLRKTGSGIEIHGKYFRFKWKGKHMKFSSLEEAAAAKDTIYGAGNWIVLAGFLSAFLLGGCVSSGKLASCERDKQELRKQVEDPDCDRVVWQCFAKEHNRMKRGK